MLVVFKDDVFRLEVVEVLDVRIQDELRCIVSLGQAGKLEEKLFLMVFVNMGVVDDVSEKARAESAHLRNHADKRCVLCHVEGHAESHVAASLHEHAVQAAVSGDVPHGQEGAGIERHVRQVLDVPEVDDHAAALRILLQCFKERVHLMVLAQLVAVCLSDRAVFSHPFIPYVAVPVLKDTDVVRLFLPDPEDFLHGCLECDELGRQDREFLFKVKLHDLVGQLVGRHAGAVVSKGSVFEDILHYA